jgi:hypothetical protein
LTAIDWNYHINIPNGKSRSGVEMVTRRYNRWTRLCDVKNVKVEKGFEYIPVQFSFQRLSNGDCMMMSI